MVKAYLPKFPAKKATGIDEISCALLCLDITGLAPSIAKLVNLSLSTGTFPCCWKQARVSSPGHNQIWICNFLQSNWLRAQTKHWLDGERTKLDRNVEQGNFEANRCRVLWVEYTLKKSNSNTEPINRDYFMRHTVRFTNIEMLMIENAFCKHPANSMLYPIQISRG